MITMMKHRRFMFPWLLILFILLAGIFSLNDGVSSSKGFGFVPAPVPLSTSLMSPARRSLMSLSPQQRSSRRTTMLIAGADGTIHLVESRTMRVIWSFSSGPPLYTSHQSADFLRQKNSFYIESGDDWHLYIHNLQFATRMKLPHSIEDFIKSTPSMSDEGAVTLGSKTTTVFEVDPVLGTLIRTYSLSNLPPESNSTKVESFINPNATAMSNNQLVNSESANPNPAKMRLQIMRTDYMLQSFAPDSNKVSWNMTIAEIGAALICQDVHDDPPTSTPSTTEEDIALPLSCQSQAFIFRHRNHVLLEPIAPKGLKHGDTILMMPSSEGEKPSHVRQDHEKMLPGSVITNNDSDLKDVQNVRIHRNNIFGNSIGWSTALSLMSVGILMGIVVHRYALLIKEKVLLHEQPTDSDSKDSPSNKKKIQSSEKNNGIVDKKNKQVPSENQDILGNSKCDDKTLLDVNKLFDSGADGRRVGKLIVSNTEIAKGSNGTIVLEGIYEGRRVAVKRLVQAHHNVAFKEIQNLIASDLHPNIVRWYGVEHDQDFVYLSLERCICSLDDLVQIYSDFSQYPASGKDHATIEYKVHLEAVKHVMPDVNLWKLNAQPSPLLLKLMRDVISGLGHLHELGIIHRDLKPQNVLITNERSLCAKLSDMGISKRLLEDMSSLDHHATGCGSSGWQAPEQLLHGRQTRAVDLFSLGCVLFFCITGGRHPFGDRLERDINIVKNQMDLFLLEDIPEAFDLISRLLYPDPELRPKALEVLHHPLFWNSETRLSFLRDTSDRVELEDRQTGSGLLKAIESIAHVALGAKWDEKMEPVFIADIGRYRRYKYDSVRDLLRVMRNKLNHYGELPKVIQELVGPVPEGFDGYFASRFPRLLIEVYKVMSQYCKQEERFQSYFRSNGEW